MTVSILTIMATTNDAIRMSVYMPKRMKAFLDEQAEKQNRSTNNLILTIFAKFKEETEGPTRTLVH